MKLSQKGEYGLHALLELARPPTGITLLEAVEALEGPTSPAPCADPDSAPTCPKRERCVFLGIWRQVDAATRGILGAVTLADLARQEQECDSAPMYHI